MSLVILMVEQLSLYCQPAIGVCVELIPVLDISAHFQIQILERRAPSIRIGLDLPLLLDPLVETDHSLHFISVPLNNNLSQLCGFDDRHFPDPG